MNNITKEKKAQVIYEADRTLDRIIHFSLSEKRFFVDEFKKRLLDHVRKAYDNEEVIEIAGSLH